MGTCSRGAEITDRVITDCRVPEQKVGAHMAGGDQTEAGDVGVNDPARGANDHDYPSLRPVITRKRPGRR